MSFHVYMLCMMCWQRLMICCLLTFKMKKKTYFWNIIFGVLRWLTSVMEWDVCYMSWHRCDAVSLLPSYWLIPNIFMNKLLLQGKPSNFFNIPTKFVDSALQCKLFQQKNLFLTCIMRIVLVISLVAGNIWIEVTY